MVYPSPINSHCYLGDGAALVLIEGELLSAPHGVTRLIRNFLLDRQGVIQPVIDWNPRIPKALQTTEMDAWIKIQTTGAILGGVEFLQINEVKILVNYDKREFEVIFSDQQVQQGQASPGAYNRTGWW